MLRVMYSYELQEYQDFFRLGFSSVDGGRRTSSESTSMALTFSLSMALKKAALLKGSYSSVYPSKTRLSLSDFLKL